MTLHSQEKRLVRGEWVDASRNVRMRFRPNGTGYYEREATEDAPFLHENLLWRVEDSQLHLKFAHARLWTQVGFTFETGAATDDGRYGPDCLHLERCAYTWAIEDRPTNELRLQHDRGAGLP